MAVEYYLQAYVDGVSSKTKEKTAETILSEYCIYSADTHCDIKLSCGCIISFYYNRNAEYIDHIMVSRPCVHNELSEILYELMDVGNFVLFSSDGAYPIVLDATVIEALPEDMVEAIGTPKVANDLKSFIRLVNEINT